jgi:hypothetical protein
MKEQKVKALIYIIFNFNRLLITSVLFKKKKYEKIIKLSKKWLAKNSNDFLSIRNIAFAYVYLDKTVDGFEYIKKIIPKIKSRKLIGKLMKYFLYYDFNNGNYDIVIDRCIYFDCENVPLEKKAEIANMLNIAKHTAVRFK